MDHEKPHTLDTSNEHLIVKRNNFGTNLSVQIIFKVPKEPHDFFLFVHMVWKGFSSFFLVHDLMLNKYIMIQGKIRIIKWNEKLFWSC